MTPDKILQAVFRPEILALSAYHVADAAGLIKLDAMENPYDWPDSLLRDWLDRLRHCHLNRYPDPRALQLAATIRRVFQIPEDCGLLLGNGSDEIIQLLIMALTDDSVVLTPEPGFVMYGQISRCLGHRCQGIPLQAQDFALDMPAMRLAIGQLQPSLIFLAYPNNPTGNLFHRQDILEILQLAPGLVIVDEAYAPFTDASFMETLQDFPHLLVMRTVSKTGLAGLRLGYIAGHPELIAQLDKVRLPYNINTLSQISTDFALSQKPLFDRQTQEICRQRSWLEERLQALSGITVYPSQANFILFRCEENRATPVFQALKAQGILIKNLHPQGGLLQDCLRVTVGKPEQNQAFLQALKKALASR